MCVYVADNFFHGSRSRRLRQIDSDSCGKKTPSEFTVYQTLKAHSCSVDWGKESVPLWEHTLHVHAATPAQPFISLQPHRMRSADTERTRVSDFFSVISCQKKNLFRNTKAIAHHILETFQADFYGPFSKRTAAQVIMESKALYANQRGFARHASLQVLVRGNLERRSASSGGDLCQLGGSFPATSTTIRN